MLQNVLPGNLVTKLVVIYAIIVKNDFCYNQYSLSGCRESSLVCGKLSSAPFSHLNLIPTPKS